MNDRVLCTYITEIGRLKGFKLEWLPPPKLSYKINFHLTLFMLNKHDVISEELQIPEILGVSSFRWIQNYRINYCSGALTNGPSLFFSLHFSRWIIKFSTNISLNTKNTKMLLKWSCIDKWLHAAREQTLCLELALEKVTDNVWFGFSFIYIALA